MFMPQCKAFSGFAGCLQIKMLLGCNACKHTDREEWFYVTYRPKKCISFTLHIHRKFESLASFLIAYSGIDKTLVSPKAMITQLRHK